MKRYNIALVFNNEVSDKIISYATSLYKIMESDVILGKNSQPHMTIAQFEVDQERAKNIWDSCIPSIIETPQLNFSGLTVLPSSKGGAWIEISVLKSKSLLILQDTVKKIIDPFTELKNDFGDSYRPHVTIAHTTTGNSFNAFPFAYEPLRLKSVNTQLAIGLGTLFDVNEKPF